MSPTLVNQDKPVGSFDQFLYLGSCANTLPLTRFNPNLWSVDYCWVREGWVQSCLYTDIDLGVLIPFVDAYRVSNDKKAAELREKTKNKKQAKKEPVPLHPKLTTNHALCKHVMVVFCRFFNLSFFLNLKTRLFLSPNMYGWLPRGESDSLWIHSRICFKQSSYIN